ILEALAEHGAYENDGIQLTERVRAALSSQLVHSYAPANRLRAVLLHPVIEETILGGIERGKRGGAIALAPRVPRGIQTSIQRPYAPIVSKGQRPATLTSAEIRRFVRKLIESHLPQVPVLSFEELPAELVIHPMGRVELVDG